MIFAIDPGNEQSAFVAWNGQIIAKGIEYNRELLRKIKSKDILSSDYTLVIEMIASYGMPVGATVFDTCVWIGRFLEAWDNRGLRFLSELIYRKDVKMHLCQSMKAKDSNIRQALIDRFGKPGTKKHPNIIYDDAKIKMKKDLWAALAVAVTFEDLSK
jgi:hypothetical protein